MLASIFEQLGESLVGGGTEFGWLLGQFLIKRKPDISDTVGRVRSFFNALLGRCGGSSQEGERMMAQ